MERTGGNLVRSATGNRLLKTTIICAIIGSLLIASSMYFTALSYKQLLFLILVCGLISLLVQWRMFYPRLSKKGLPVGFFLLYNFAGVGFLLAGLFLMANWAGAGKEETIEKYKIVGIDRDYTFDPCCSAVLLLENNAYAEEPDIRSMPYHTAKKNKELPVFRIIKRKGLLGIPIYKAKEMAVEEKTEVNNEEESIAED